MCCFVAEWAANYSLWTLDYAGAVVEAALWTVAMLAITPYAFFIWKAASNINTKKVDTFHLRSFSIATGVTGFIFTAFMIVDYNPMTYKSWKRDLAENKPHLSMYDGVVSSIFDRVRSQKWEQWQDDYKWTFGYFTGAVWYAIFLMTAPRLHLRQEILASKSFGKSIGLSNDEFSTEATTTQGE